MDQISETEWVEYEARGRYHHLRNDPQAIQAALELAQSNDDSQAFASEMMAFVVRLDGAMTDTTAAFHAYNLCKWLLKCHIEPALLGEAKLQAQAAWDRLQSTKPDADAREGV